MAKIFISYSHADRGTAEDLATRLRNAGAEVWLDKWEIGLGDSILWRINDGISTSDFLVVLLSKASVSSKWVKEELAEAGVLLAERGAFILPVLLEDCEVPLFLRHRRYANFGRNPEEAFSEILAKLNQHDALKKRDAARALLDLISSAWSRKMKSSQSESERASLRSTIESQFASTAEEMHLSQRLYLLWIDQCLEAGRYLYLADTITKFGEVAIATSDLEFGREITRWIASYALDVPFVPEPAP